MSYQIEPCFKAPLSVVLHRQEKDFKHKLIQDDQDINTGALFEKPLASVVMLFGFRRMLYLCIGSRDQRLAAFDSRPVSFPSSLGVSLISGADATCSADVARTRQLAVATAGNGGGDSFSVFCGSSVLVGAFEQQRAASTLLIRSRLAEENEASFISLKLLGQDEKQVHVPKSISHPILGCFLDSHPLQFPPLLLSPLVIFFHFVPPHFYSLLFDVSLQKSLSSCLILSIPLLLFFRQCGSFFFAALCSYV